MKGYVNMKNYIIVIPLQPAGSLKKCHYSNPDNDPLLDSDFETSFPVLIPMANSVEKGEKIRVTTVITYYQDDIHPNCANNLKLFEGELNVLSQRLGFEYGELCKIKTSYEETPEKQKKPFKDLINSFEKGDSIYADITFGNKPTPIVLQMALNYIYSASPDSFVEAVVYGDMVRSPDKPTEQKIYDVSSLFFINSVVGRLALVRPEDPLAFVNGVLDL